MYLRIIRGMVLVFLVLSGIVFSPDFDLDVDDDGETKALTDGLITLPYLFGDSDASLLADVAVPNAERSTSEEILRYLDTNRAKLDVDGDGSAEALTDGILIHRDLFGISGDPLIQGSISSNATRNMGREVTYYISSIKDSDNDGVNDSSDAFILDPGEYVDTDGDGIGDNTDTNNNPGAVSGFSQRVSRDLRIDNKKDGLALIDRASATIDRASATSALMVANKSIDEQVSEIEIVRFCNSQDGSLVECKAKLLFTPQAANSCDPSVRYSAKENLSGLEYALPDVSAQNVGYMENVYGTSYMYGQSGKLLFNPAIVFSDEAFFLGKKVADGQVGGKILIDREDFAVNNHGTVNSDVYLYDDGTNGDAVAGDGFYTSACVFHTGAAAFFEGDNSTDSILNLGDLQILNPNLRGSEEIFHVSENILATTGGFFAEIGYDFTHTNNNNLPLTNNPWDFCEACKSVLPLLGDKANIITLTPRDWSSKAWMLRLNDHARGAGFYYSELDPNYVFPAMNYDSRPLSDGNNHLEIRAVINVAGPDFAAFEHEFEHALFGQAGDEFPNKDYAINSQDGMHLDSDVTANSTLQGPFKIRNPDGEGYRAVKWQNDQESDIYDTQLRRVGDSFRVVPLDYDTKTSDLFLYMAGLKTKEQVTDTYYKLANPSLEGCTEDGNDYICNDQSEVLAEQVYTFGIDDWIAKYGEWSYAYGDIPDVYNVAIINFSDRGHSEAEIIYSSNYSRFIASQGETLQQIADIRGNKRTLDYLHSGLLDLNVNAVDMLIHSPDYFALTKSEPNESRKFIYVQDVEAYKELYIAALKITTLNDDGSICYGCPYEEDDMNQAVVILSSAINLVDELAHAYFTRGLYYYHLGRFKEALADANAAAERIHNQFPVLTSSYSGLSSYMAILALRVSINGELGDQNLVDEDTKNIAKYAVARAWQTIDAYIALINAEVNNVCQIKPVNGYYDKSIYLDPNSTCTFTNISLDESAEIQYVVDGALWRVTQSFYRIGTYFDDLALLDSPKEDQLAALKKSIDAYSQGIQYDTAGSSWFYKFLLRNIYRAYGELANVERFPTLTPEEVEYAQNQSAYYAEQEAQLNEQCLEKWTGTFYAKYCGV